jgi:hypothetical protein
VHLLKKSAKHAFAKTASVTGAPLIAIPLMFGAHAELSIESMCGHVLNFSGPTALLLEHSVAQAESVAETTFLFLMISRTRSKIAAESGALKEYSSFKI